jgi:putative hydrolase of the HAD superfamily
MIQALKAIKGNLIQACLTNNIVSPKTQLSDENVSIAGKNEEIMGLFDFVIASSEQNVRKPDPAFYYLALNRAGIEAKEAVFLDDLGINLKPAKALGMHTIKVINAHDALKELNAVLPINIL